MVAAMMVAAPTRAAAFASPCRLPGARVLARDRGSRLFVQSQRSGAQGLYGCVRGRPPRRLTGSVGGVEPYTGAGPVLAGRWTLFKSRDGWGETLVRADLRSGRRRIIVRLHARITGLTSDAYVLRRTGSLAYVLFSSGASFETGTRFVVVAQRGHRARTADRAGWRVFEEPDPIPDASLALVADGRVAWTHGGQPRTARLR
jgi:hypothetical protein